MRLYAFVCGQCLRQSLCVSVPDVDRCAINIAAELEWLGLRPIKSAKLRGMNRADARIVGKESSEIANAAVIVKANAVHCFFGG
jgi:hypothetical protein